MANTYSNILKYGTQASYDAITTKDATVLYFCTDSKKIFKGDVEMTESVIIAAEKPAAPITGRVYILTGSSTAAVYDGTNWHEIGHDIETSITSSSTNEKVAGAKAVYDFVEDEIGKVIGGEDVIKKVEVSETAGNIKVTNGKGTATDVAVHGAVTTPTYDATTRKFTFPVVDGDDVVVELGKDIFIDPAGNNRYEGGYIYLYLNDGTGTKDPTELKIPVTGLITDYFGDATDSISVTVDKDTHKVTANAVLRPDVTTEGSEFTNALKLSSTEGAKGLYVDLSAYQTAAVTNAKIKTAQDAADAAQATADANTTAIAVLNGTESTDGSVAKTVKTAVDTLKNGEVATNTANIAALAAATTAWGTF